MTQCPFLPPPSHHAGSFRPPSGWFSPGVLDASATVATSKARLIAQELCSSDLTPAACLYVPWTDAPVWSLAAQADDGLFYNVRG